MNLSSKFFSLFKEGAKGILCVNNGTIVQLNSFTTSSNTRPRLEALSDGYILTDSYITSNNSVVCKFTQKVNVPSGSENLMHNLVGPLHNLIARGDYDMTSGHVSFHADQRLFTEKIDVTPSEVMKVSVIFVYLTLDDYYYEHAVNICTEE